MSEFIENRLGYCFKDKNLLELALTHSSFSNEHGKGHIGCNERLEFLGDSILGFVVAGYMYRNYPELPEGKLSKMRADLVCEKNLAIVANNLELGKYIKLGRGESANGGDTRSSILSDAVESLIAAVYLDGGFEPARNLIHSFVLDGCLPPEELDFDYKSRLQEYIQKVKDQHLIYRLVEASGPDHDKEFRSVVLCNDKLIGEGTGGSKKKSEQAAAKNAIEALCPEIL